MQTKGTSKSKKQRKGARCSDDKFRKDRRDSRSCPENDAPESNDPEWYAQNPQLLKDAASLSYAYVSGVPISMDYSTTDESSYTGNPILVPGIMTLEVVPCPGYSYTPIDAVNSAAVAMYSYVRHANSGHANYDASDLMIYCLAMAQVYSYINWLQRIYGTSQIYANYNRYLPRGIAAANNVDYTDLTMHLADFRYGINALITRAASLACPAEMPYFRRMAFLFSGLYSEGESVKDQLYMYTPAGFMLYSDKTSETGGSLNFVAAPGTGTNKATVNDLLSYGNSLLQPILQSEDMNIMSGDILKAYGGNILKLQTLPEVYTVLPVTDLAVLEQMQNATICSNYGTLSATVTQNLAKNVLKIDVHYDNSLLIAEALTNQHVLTTILTDPTPADTIERTRMMHSAVSMKDDEGIRTEIYAGSDFVHAAWMYNQDQAGNFLKRQIPSWVYIDNTTTVDQMGLFLEQHCELENFKFHPAVYYNRAGNIFNLALDFDNFTIVHRDTLNRMNEAAMLSLFNVPSIAKF